MAITYYILPFGSDEAKREMVGDHIAMLAQTDENAHRVEVVRHQGKLFIQESCITFFDRENAERFFTWKVAQLRRMHA